LKGELIDNRIVVWNIKDSQKLFMNGYYGKPIGIPKPKLNEINVPLILDLMEGYYLLQKSIISIYKVKKKITETEMLEICRDEYHNFDKKISSLQKF
jgi:tRNA-intron endonuclease